MVIWCAIPGLEGYSASSDGQIKGPDGLIAGYFHQGYRWVNAGNKYKVAALVLMAFVGPRPAGYVVRHLNDIRSDDRIENLAWGTRSENARDAMDNGRDFGQLKTECINGHEYTPANTYIAPSGARACRICNRDKARRRRSTGQARG